MTARWSLFLKSACVVKESSAQHVQNFTSLREHGTDTGLIRQFLIQDI